MPALSQSTYGTPRLMQGPMLGASTESQISVWIRTSGSFPCRLEVDRNPDFTSPTRSAAIVPHKNDYYCVVLNVQNLQADTKYYYRILIQEEVPTYLENKAPFSCRTAPIPGARTRFRVGIGSCARFQEDRIQPIWDALKSWAPDLFFWMGDNIYGDTRDPDILAEEYQRQRDVASLQPLLHSIPHLAIWDDHDFALNNHDRTNPVKKEALHVFQQYWANPGYGLPDAPGVYFKYSYGGVDFFCIDCRYHRDPNIAPDTPDKTMLGAKQLSWLKNNLKRSDAPFKIIISGSGWSKAKGFGGDAWSSYLHERDAFFDFIRDEKISGVVLLSGDTHVGELNAIPWSDQGGYDLYDLVSSPLAQSPGTGWFERRPEIRIRPLYYSGPNVGVIEFDLRERPKLRFDLVDEYGISVWEPFVLYADELVNGIQSWTSKIDPDEMKRRMNELEGKGYYAK